MRKPSPIHRMIRILSITALLTFAIHLFSHNKADVDLWGNVGFVRGLPGTEAFHRTNTFSFTDPDHTWINHEWLSQFILNRTFQYAGNSGLLALKISLGLTLLGILTLSIRRESHHVGLASFLFFLTALSSLGYGFSTRPHLFTYVLFALFLLVLKHKSRQGTVLLLLPLVGLLWANLHGAFFLGILVLLVYTLGESIKTIQAHCLHQPSPANWKPALLPAPLFLVSLCNPYGIQLWSFIVESAGIPRPYLSEWAPFNPLLNFSDHVDFIALTLLCGLALLFSRRPRDISWMLILTLAFLSALFLRRHIPIFAITAAFIIPEHLESAVGHVLDRIAEKMSALFASACLIALIALSATWAVWYHKSNPLQIEIPQDRFPVAVVRFMEENRLEGNLLSFFDWAEYCIWKLHPRCKIFFDGRFSDAYSTPIISDYLTLIYLGDNWQTIPDRYHVTMMLLHRENPLYAAMAVQGEWQLAAQDNVGALFLHKPTYSNFLQQCEEGAIPVPVVQKTEYFP